MMISPRTNLVLEHVFSKEQKEVEILSSNKNWNLFVRWDIQGCYTLNLKTNRLKRSPQARIDLLWQAVDKDYAVKVWKEMEGIK